MRVILAILVSFAHASLMSRVIGNARMYRGYLSESDQQAKARVIAGLSNLDVPPWVTRHVWSINNVSRRLFTKSRRALNKIFQFPVRSHLLKVTVQDLYTDAASITRSWVDTVYPDGPDAFITRVLDEASSLRSESGRSARSGETPFSRAFKITRMYTNYFSTLSNIIEEGYLKLAAAFARYAIRPDQYQLAMKAFWGLAGDSSQDSWKVFTRAERKFYQLLVSYNGRAIDAKLIQAYRRNQLLLHVVLTEKAIYTGFSRLCDFYFQKVVESSPDYLDIKTRKYKAASTRATTLRGELTASNEKVVHLSELSKWWTDSVQVAWLPKLRDALKFDEAITVKHGLAEAEEKIAFGELVELAALVRV